MAKKQLILSLLFGCLMSSLVHCTADLSNLTGYSHRNGDCPGNDIRKITRTSVEVCRQECTKDENCLSFLFVLQGRRSYCWLKTNECSRLTMTSTRNFHFYNKLATTMATATPDYEIDGYRHRLGDCGGNDIKPLTRTTLSVCKRECDSLEYCVSFIYVDSGRNSYCWLKNNECRHLTDTYRNNFHFYNKIAEQTTFTSEGPQTACSVDAVFNRIVKGVPYSSPTVNTLKECGSLCAHDVRCYFAVETFLDGESKCKFFEKTAGPLAIYRGPGLAVTWQKSETC